MQLNSIFRRIENKERLNILTFPTHERYQQGFGLTDHTFFMYRGKHIKDWEIKYGKIPENHILLPNGQIPNDIGFDLVLSQNKFGQFPIAERISRHLNIPMISLEHTLPVPSWNKTTRQQLHDMQGDLNVFISDFSRREWGFTNMDNTQIIHHMVDTDIFVPRYTSREIVFLSVVNDWIGRDWCCGFNMWKRIVDAAKLPVKVLGDTPGLSKPASSIDELSDTYAKCKFFINTSTVSPIPTALLEAMSSECICISTATCMIPEIIKDGYNGFISNDENILASRCKDVMENPDKYAYIGQNARKTILEYFHKDRFVNNWNDAFRSVLCIK